MATTTPISSRIDQAVAGQGQAPRAATPIAGTAPTRRPPAPHTTSRFWSGSRNRHSQPSSGHASDRVDEPERDPVRGADRRGSRSPRRSGRGSSPADGSRNIRTWTIANRMRASSRAPAGRSPSPAARPRTPAGAGPSGARTAPPRRGTRSARAGRAGPARGAASVGCGGTAGWLLRRGRRASPGRAPAAAPPPRATPARPAGCRGPRSRACSRRTPASDRDRSASGVDCLPTARITSPNPG